MDTFQFQIISTAHAMDTFHSIKISHCTRSGLHFVPKKPRPVPGGHKSYMKIYGDINGLLRFRPLKGQSGTGGAYSIMKVGLLLLFQVFTRQMEGQEICSGACFCFIIFHSLFSQFRIVDNLLIT
jgi:hypothetical protein